MFSLILIKPPEYSIKLTFVHNNDIAICMLLRMVRSNIFAFSNLAIEKLRLSGQMDCKIRI